MLISASKDIQETRRQAWFGFLSVKFLMAHSHWVIFVVSGVRQTDLDHDSKNPVLNSATDLSVTRYKPHHPSVPLNFSFFPLSSLIFYLSDKFCGNTLQHVQCIRNVRSPPKTQKILILKLKIQHNQNTLSWRFNPNSSPKTHIRSRWLEIRQVFCQ